MSIGSRIYRYKRTVTPSSGSISFNTLEIRGILRSILISPATSTTKWRVSLTNDESVVIYRKGRVTGDLADFVSRAVYGIYTVALTGASADEAITFTLVYEELQ